MNEAMSGAQGIPALAGVLEDRVLIVVPFMVLLLPLLGFVVLSLFGDAIQRQKEARGAGFLACLTVLASFGLSVWSVIRLLGLVGSKEGLRFSQPYLGFEWMEAGGFRVPMSL